MCGIAGYIGQKPISEQRQQMCLSLMQRRGPDASGVVARNQGDQHVLLLHSRLSIMELSAQANQPFTSNGHDLIFNGELYNAAEVRSTLKQSGQLFHTERSDTEVLLQQLIHHGVAGLDVCEGMWAFAWYDEKNRCLTLCRDRFGEKPLYVYRTDHGVFFASEVKFLQCLSGVKLTPNISQLQRYLVNGYKSLYKQPATFYNEIEEVKPGECWQLSTQGLRKSRYWQPRFAQYNDCLTWPEVVEQAQAQLIRATALRLRSDVPVAFCLSGGVDSNALVGLALQQLQYEVHGFTIMNTDSRYEERDMIEQSIDYFGVAHTQVSLRQSDFLEELTQLEAQHDGPVSTISHYAHFQLMKAIQQAGYKVAIGGVGADELFSGYYDHHNAYLHAMHETEHYTSALNAYEQTVQPFVRNPYLKNAQYFIETPEARSHIFLDAEAFSDYLQEDWLEPFSETHYTDTLLRNRMANELFHESVPVILHAEDLNAMYFSIENRAPFLDRQLFEWSQTIPTKFLVKDGLAKAILRASVSGMAPEAVINNPRKVGFNAPILDYLDVNDDRVRQQLLDNSPVFDVIKRDKIEQLICQSDLPNSQSKFLFYFLNAKLFLERCAA